MSTDDEPLYRPLPKPPSAVALTVRKLIGLVHAGGIRVPHFQRPLRWEAADVVKLFDSLLKGYPIGSLLFWKKPFDADPAFVIGGARIAVDAAPDGWGIVDGQQRITSLAAALLDLDHAGDMRWVVRFDPVDNVLSGPASPADAARHVPLRVLGDLRRLGRWLGACALSESEQTRVEEVQQRILDYELGCSVVEGAEGEGLEGAFARMNSTGKRMRADEIFQALFGPRTQATARRVDLAALAKAADVDGFGQPARGEALKALLAMSGLDPLKRVDDVAEKELAGVVREDDACEAIHRAASFLQAPTSGEEPGADIPAAVLLPYPVVFPLLARWFYLFPATDAPTRRGLATWLWRGALAGVHLHGAKSAVRFQVKNIRDDPASSLRRLLDAVGTPASREWRLEPFKHNHAASRIELLALLTLGPSYSDGERVPLRALLSSGGRLAREVFRIDRIESGPVRELARTGANRALLDVKTTDLSTKLLSWTNREALGTHLVDDVAGEALRDGRATDFLTHRAARLRVLVASFLAGRAELDGPLVMPVDAYFERPQGGAGVA